MDATNFNNDKPEVAEKFECNVSRAMSVASRAQTPQNKNYLVTKTENKTAEKFEYNVSRVMSRTQSPQTKNYLAQKSGGGIQKRAFVPTVPKPFKFYTELRASKSRNKENSPKSPFLENPTRFDAKSGKVRSNTLTVPKSPYLRIKDRSKPTTILSTEEREISKVQKPKLTESYSPAITKPKTLHAQSFPNFEPEIPRKPECPSSIEPIDFYGEHKRFREKEVEEQRIAKIRKEESLHAQPLLNFAPEIPRKPECPPPTEPIGFSDTRMEERHISDEHRIFREKEAEEQRISKIMEEEPLHAQSLPNFELEISRKPECSPPTEPIGFSDTRMEERHISDEHKRFREKEAEEKGMSNIREEEVRNAINIQPSARPISPMIGEKYMKLLNNYEYSFRDSLFDLDNIDNINDPILHSYQITGVCALTPIYECEITE